MSTVRWRAPRLVFLARALAVLGGMAAAVACATSDDPGAAPPVVTPEQDGGLVLVVDGGADSEADAVVDAAPPTCSKAGWCITPLPDSTLSFFDVWPLANHTFGLAGSDGQGVKVLDWDEASRKWSYIDDGSQNQLSNIQQYSVWAPSENEVWYSVVDAAGFLSPTGTLGSYVYRGTRPVAPATAWTWQPFHFVCPAGTVEFSPKVWGTGPNDVYVASCGDVFHWKGSPGADAGATDAGAGNAGWNVDFADSDPPATRLQITAIDGTGPDDVWFAGGRQSICGVLLHKTGTGYTKLADGTVAADGTCAAKPGLHLFKGSFYLASAAPQAGHFLGLLENPNDALAAHLVRVIAQPGGTYDYALAAPPPSFGVSMTALWGIADDDLWIGVGHGGGTSVAVLRAGAAWSDAGTYAYSTVSLNGAPNPHPITQIRGLADDNLWAVGDGVAFHKTTH